MISNLEELTSESQSPVRGSVLSDEQQTQNQAHQATRLNPLFGARSFRTGSVMVNLTPHEVVSQSPVRGSVLSDCRQRRP